MMAPPALTLGAVLLSIVSLATAVTNPSPLVTGPFADPRTIKVGDTYYGFATNNYNHGGFNVPSMSSTKFNGKQTWTKLDRDVLPDSGDWTNNTNSKGKPQNPQVWDPAVMQFSDTRFVMYYAADPRNNQGPGGKNKHCIGVAVSTTGIQGKYVPQKDAFICSPNGQQGFISPNPFRIGDQNYIVFKKGMAQKSDLRIVKLNSSGDGIVGKQHVIFSPTPQEYDAEGPTIVQNPKTGNFILLYVVGFFRDTSYGIHWAVSKSIIPPNKGQYTRPANNVLLHTGTNNGVSLTAPGGPDFPDAQIFGQGNVNLMTFMTYKGPPPMSGNPTGSRFMREAYVTFDENDNLSVTGSFPTNV